MDRVTAATTTTTGGRETLANRFAVRQARLLERTRPHGIRRCGLRLPSRDAPRCRTGARASVLRTHRAGRRLLLRGDAVEGRLIWAGGQPGMREPYAVVVDGRPMSWDDFGRALEPFEGFRFRLTVEEDNVVVSDLDPQPKG